MNINDENAQKFIIIATIVLLASTTSAIANPLPGQKQLKPTRTIVGGIGAMFISAIVAEIDPKLGVALATLVAGGAFIKYGLPRINSYFPEETRKKK